MPHENDDDEALARFKIAEERVRKTPPKCLEGFRVEPSNLVGLSFDGHGEPLNSVFHLRCSCGHDRFVVLGHHLTNRGIPIFVSPLALQCSACGKITELIDTKYHGFDAQFEHGSTTIRGDGERTPFACSTCGVSPMTAHARFEHSGETLADRTGLFAESEQEYFSWFSLVGECDGCKQLLRVVDFECA